MNVKTSKELVAALGALERSSSHVNKAKERPDLDPRQQLLAREAARLLFEAATKLHEIFI